MTNVAMTDEDRAELERRCAKVEEYARAVEERDRFMTELYDAYRADPVDLQKVSGLRSPAQLYAAFHRYGSQRVRLRAHRPAAREKRQGEAK